MQLLKIFNDEGVSEAEYRDYEQRISVRAIIVDDEGRIALIHSKRFDYHELPGGGVEEGETIEESLVRECREESGCGVEIVSEVGVTLEIRKEKRQTNTAHCFRVRVVGEKGEPRLMEDEIEDGAAVIWVKPDEAREILVNQVVTAENLYQRYVTERFVVFFDKAFV